MGRQPTEQAPPGSARPKRAVVFRYELVDLAGRDLGVIEQQAPPRQDETIVLDGDAWRIVAVLGRSVTVVRAARNAAEHDPEARVALC